LEFYQIDSQHQLHLTDKGPRQYSKRIFACSLDNSGNSVENFVLKCMNIVYTDFDFGGEEDN